MFQKYIRNRKSFLFLQGPYKWMYPYCTSYVPRYIVLQRSLKGSDCVWNILAIILTFCTELISYCRVGHDLDKAHGSDVITQHNVFIWMKVLNNWAFMLMLKGLLYLEDVETAMARIPRRHSWPSQACIQTGNRPWNSFANTPCRHFHGWTCISSDQESLIWHCLLPWSLQGSWWFSLACQAWL